MFRTQIRIRRFLMTQMKDSLNSGLFLINLRLFSRHGINAGHFSVMMLWVAYYCPSRYERGSARAGLFLLSFVKNITTLDLFKLLLCTYCTVLHLTLVFDWRLTL
jgi:hypothetical protein